MKKLKMGNLKNLFTFHLFMQSKTFTFKDQDGVKIFVYKWLPDPKVKTKAVVQLVHGAAEHAARYIHVAEALTNAGYAVYADDHRGHGKTAQKKSNLGKLKPGDGERMVRDLKELTDIIKKENPSLPVFLLGHSMGSILAQLYIENWGDELKGVLLTGTTGELLKLPAGLDLVSIQRKIEEKGLDAPAEEFQEFTKASNEAFKPAKTGFEWLTRDEAEVQKYVNDPFCGFPLSYGFVIELAKVMFTVWDAKNLQKISKNLPIYIFVGSMDVASGMSKGAEVLYNNYQKLGIKDVKFKVYPGGRHELFNETNREEVIRDV
ncbi:MAG: alpha/beta hydrolase, partial [Candidatus Jordarchaeaceae archaeon]